MAKSETGGLPDDSDAPPGPARETAPLTLGETLQLFGEKRRWILGLLALLAVAVIGVLDAQSGYEFGFSPFYLIPITITSFYGGRGIGVGTAVFATLAWYLAGVHAHPPYANPLAIYWNSAVRLLIFTVIALLLARLKEDRGLEKAHRERLSEANRLKDQFVGMAAHDLRTPLAVISMCATSMQSRQGDAPDQRQAESLRVILEKSDFMLKMVADLLDLSAIESGSLSLKKRSGDYGNFVRRHLELLQILAERKNIVLELESGTLPEVRFDEGRIEQVLDNMVMNAVKFSPPNTAITVSVTLEGEQVVTRVTDRGPGIPEEELPLVFVAFAKTSVQASGGEKGSGLGLAIAKKIVEAHGGEIDVCCAPGEGTTFRFTLPLLGR